MGKVVQRQDKGLEKWLHQVPFCIIALVALLLVLDPGGISSLTRVRTSDLYQRLIPRPNTEAPSFPVVHVDIDLETTRRLGRWPWPRTLLAELNDRVHDLGAQTVLLDLVLSEPDPTSPDQLIETWWNQPGMGSLVVPLSRLPDHDAQLAQSLTRGNVVTSFAYTPEPSNQTPLRKARFQNSDTGRTLIIPNLAGVVTTIPSLSAASSGIGSQHFMESEDGVTRFIPLIAMMNGTIYPNQILETVRVSQRISQFDLVTRSTGDVSQVIGIRIGEITVPTNKDGSLSLYYSHASEQPSYSAWQVLRPDFDPAALRNAIVVIGASADRQAMTTRTSYGERVTATQVSAEAIRQILSGHFLYRPGWAMWAELAYLIIVGLIIVALAYRLPLYGAAAFTLVALGGAVYGTWSLFGDRGLLLDPSIPSIGILMAYLSAGLISSARTEREKDFVRTAFGNYLAPSSVSRIARSSTNPNFAGETRRATVMFCDIRGLDAAERTFAEHPREIIKLVSDFLTIMTKRIHDSKGTVNRYVGDRIMAVWNAPIDDPDHASHACECALLMLSALDSLNDRLEDEARRKKIPVHTVHLGIGINTGTCFAGITGSKLREDYSVLGEPVRLANRLNHFSERYGPAIILGEQTYMAVHHAYALLEIDHIEMQGEEDPTRIFALVGNPVMKANPKFRALEEAHESIFSAFRQCDWEKAKSIVNQTRFMSGAMPSLYDIYERRILFNQVHPPADDWRGGHPGP